MDGRIPVALRFLEDHADEAARLLETVPPDATVALLSEASAEVAAGLLRRMVANAALACLERLPAGRAVAAVVALPLSVAAALLRRLPAERREALLHGLGPEPAGALRRLLAWPEDAAGGRMDPRLFTLPDDLRVAEAVARLRERPEYALYYLYVVDREQRLAGVLHYRDLLLASESAPLRSVMRTPVASLRAELAGEALAGDPAWRGYLALPVVDAQGLLLGVVRYESVRDLEWGRREGAGAPGRRLAGAVWRGVSELLAGGRGDARPAAAKTRGEDAA